MDININNIVYIYITPKQFWSILKCGKKKRISKKLFSDLLPYKTLITIKEYEKIKKKNLNQYYTKPFIVNLCIGIFKNIINVEKKKDLIIEPSAGKGAFVNKIKKICDNFYFLDIDPKSEKVYKSDFLKFDKNLKSFNKIHILGNPPFNKLNLFIKKACSLADSVSFILPLSFRKDSKKKLFPLNFFCILDEILPKKNFFFDNKVVSVPTVFQIWKKKKNFRKPLPILKPEKFFFVKKEDNPELSIRRVGYYAGDISLDTQNKSKSSHYFLKLLNINKFDFLKIYKSISFDENNTVGPRSISKQELILKINEKTKR